MQSFLIDLYREHLDEASFLYQQCRHLRRDAEMPWTGVHAFEQRLEAHLDALVVGGELALSVCRTQAQEGDAGELFAAMCVFCRQMNAPYLTEALKALTLDEPERMQAAAEAMKAELPVAWQDHFVRALTQGGPALTPVLLALALHRRWPTDGALSRWLAQPQCAWQTALLQACGHATEPELPGVLRAGLGDAEPNVREAAWLAGLMIREPELLKLPARQPANPAVSPLALGLAGDRGATLPLVNQLSLPGPVDGVLQALGLLGDLAAVRPLARCLSMPERAEAAALALHVITGAPLYEEVFVPDEADQADRADDNEPQRLDYKPGARLPQQGDGKTMGSTVRRLSHDPQVWEAWLTAQASQFVGGVRYRMGQPLSPALLLSCLGSTVYPKAYRAWLPRELAIRYRVDLPFDIDLSAAQQARLLQEAAAMHQAAFTAYQPGRWYTDAQLLQGAA